MFAIGDNHHAYSTFSMTGYCMHGLRNAAQQKEADYADRMDTAASIPEYAAMATQSAALKIIVPLGYIFVGAVIGSAELLGAVGELMYAGGLALYARSIQPFAQESETARSQLKDTMQKANAVAIDACKRFAFSLGTVGFVLAPWNVVLMLVSHMTPCYQETTPRHLVEFKRAQVDRELQQIDASTYFGYAHKTAAVARQRVLDAFTASPQTGVYTFSNTKYGSPLSLTWAGTVINLVRDVWGGYERSIKEAEEVTLLYTSQIIAGRVLTTLSYLLAATVLAPIETIVRTALSLVLTLLASPEGLGKMQEFMNYQIQAILMDLHLISCVINPLTLVAFIIGTSLSDSYDLPAATNSTMSSSQVEEDAAAQSFSASLPTDADAAATVVQAPLPALGEEVDPLRPQAEDANPDANPFAGRATATAATAPVPSAPNVALAAAATAPNTPVHGYDVAWEDRIDGAGWKEGMNPFADDHFAEFE